MGWTALLLITSWLPIHKTFKSVQPLQHPLLAKLLEKKSSGFLWSALIHVLSWTPTTITAGGLSTRPPQRLHFQSEKPEAQRTGTILREHSSFIRPWLQVSLSISAVFLHCKCQGLTWAETESEKMRMLLLWQFIITFIFIWRVWAFVNSCFFSVS